MIKNKRIKVTTHGENALQSKIRNQINEEITLFKIINNGAHIKM
jgi:hypothetical protein